MARARNIKPGLYKNEDLAECSVWARFIFPGLWMLADRDGRMEDRPKRIKGELLPYDSIEVEPLLAELAEHGFIRRYEVCGERFIAVVKFLDHQAPHGTEKDGGCPDEKGLLTVHERGKNGYITGNFTLEPYRLTVKEQKSEVVEQSRSTANSGLTVNDGSQDGGENTLIPDLLNPDSLFTDSLIPDSPNPEPQKRLPPALPEAAPKKSRAERPAVPTSETWSAYETAYEMRYGTKPVRNATVNGQMANFVKRIGQEEGPAVAAWYVSHNNRYYVQMCHSVAAMVKDAEKLRTEWVRRRQITAAEANQVDKTQTNFNAFAPLIEAARERERESNNA